MSVNKLGMILFSSFLIFATAPVAPAQSSSQDTTKKQKQILDGTMSMNSTVKPFMDAIEKAVPKKRLSQK